MSKGSNSIIDLIRLLLLVILLPLILFMIGPLLVIAAIRGSITLGALQLRPGKYYHWGRIWAFSLGIILWVFIWGGIVQFWPPNFSMPTRLPTWIKTGETIETIIQQIVGPTTPQVSPSPTSTVALTATVASATATHTPLPSLTVTPLPSPTAIATATISATLLPTRSTALSQTVPSPTLFPLQQDELTQVLDEANTLLIQYLQAPIPAQEAALKTIWIGDALHEIQTFAQTISVKYQTPLTITYRIIGTPTITSTGASSVTIETREFWTFEDADAKKESLSNYVYTLQAKSGGWNIVSYQFNVLPLPTTPIPITNTKTISLE